MYPLAFLCSHLLSDVFPRYESYATAYLILQCERKWKLLCVVLLHNMLLPCITQINVTHMNGCVDFELHMSVFILVISVV